VGLVFSSPFEPTLLDGSTIDHGSVALVDPLPSPAPEPGTVIIWTCGIALAVLRGLKHRRA
jgi:hypothetical protein